MATSNLNSIPLQASNRLNDDDIDVGEALTFGQLVCDLEVEHWAKFSLEAFIEMLAEISDCFYRCCHPIFLARSVSKQMWSVMRCAFTFEETLGGTVIQYIID